jgi:hypothetical protein
MSPRESSPHLRETDHIFKDLSVKYEHLRTHLTHKTGNSDEVQEEEDLHELHEVNIQQYYV